MAPFKGPRDKGHRDIRDLKLRYTVFAHFRGPSPLQWTELSLRDLTFLKKDQYTVSRFTNAIKIAKKRVTTRYDICCASIRSTYTTAPPDGLDLSLPVINFSGCPVPVAWQITAHHTSSTSGGTHPRAVLFRPVQYVVVLAPLTALLVP